MPTQVDCFDEFLRRIRPFMGSLYQSLQFACVAARFGVGWVLVSGKAVLSTEPFTAGPEISEIARLPDLLVALSGRIRAGSINSLVSELRNSSLAPTQLTPETIKLVAETGAPYSWRMAGVCFIDKALNPSARWSRSFQLVGTGPDVSSLVRIEIDSELRLRKLFNGFDGLSGHLELPARRNNLRSSFTIEAELPARFQRVRTDPMKRTLEIDIECVGSPELMIEWLPQHTPLEAVPRPWRRRVDTDSYHISVPLRDGATAAELRLALGEIDSVDVLNHDILRDGIELPGANQAWGVKGVAVAKPEQLLFETAFHSYTSDGRVDEGGAGTVFKAHNEDGDSCAIKRLDANKTTTEKLKRFENELSFCRNQSHRNIVKVLDQGYATVGGKKTPFYVMPFFPKTLRHLMRDGVPKEKILPYFAQVLDGVEAAHLLKVWHRDLKPENILHDPRTDTLVVADFGIAHFEEEGLYTAVETKDGAKLANFQYAAPEQRARGKKVDQRADIYALGLILNEMFTAEVPYGTEYRLIARVSGEMGFLDNIVENMLRQAPEERPTTIADVKTLVQRHQAEVVSLQRLSKMDGSVIKATEIDEPLAQEPPRLIRADWVRGRLTLTLDRPTTPEWVNAIQRMPGYTFSVGKEPSAFSFHGNTASVDAQEHEVQLLINHFKEWLPLASRTLRSLIEQRVKEEEHRKREQLSREREAEEQRLRVLRNLKI